MAKNKLNRLLNQSFQQGCARPRYTTFDNFSLGDKRILYITTRWHVTHVSNPSAKPWSTPTVRLLKVHLLKPFKKDFIRGQVITTSDEYPNTHLETVIPEAQTREIIIHCHVSKILKPEKPLKVYLAVEDQLANKHKLPPVLVTPMPTGK